MLRHEVWTAGLLALLIIASWASAEQKRPLTESDLLRLLEGGVYRGRFAMLVHERGIAFSPTKRDLELLQHSGADEELQRAVVAAQQSQRIRAVPRKTCHRMASSGWTLVLALRGSLLKISELPR